MAQQPEKPSPEEQFKLDEAGRRYKEERAERARREAAAAAYDKARTYPETPTSPKTEKKAKGGIIKSSASRRADGIAKRGKTKGRFV